MNTKPHLYFPFAICWTFALAIACNDSNDQKHSAAQPGIIHDKENGVQPASEDESDTISEDFEISQEVNNSKTWSILNTSTDWNTKDELNANELAKLFPVSSDESMVAFIDHGNDFFTARIKVLRSAKKSIRMQTFIFRSDESGQALAGELVAAKVRGLKVELIVDPFINYKPEDRRLLLHMVQKGVVVRGYEPAYHDLLKSFDTNSNFVEQVFDQNYRFHQKMIITDGDDQKTATAILGGVNAANEYFALESANTEYPWVDRDVALHGAVVVSMSQAFDRNITEMTTLFADDSDLSDSPLADITGYGSLIYNLIQRKFTSTPAIVKKVQALSDSASTYKFKWETAEHVRFIQSRPRMNEDLIFPAYINAIEEAQSEILISNSYFLPEEPLILALRRAVVRGVHVKILTIAKELTDVPQQVEIARTRYKFLLDANSIVGAKGSIEISEWSGDSVLHNKLGLNHAKYAVLDRSLGIVGSYNLDPRSHSYNAETVAIFSGATKTIKLMEREFNENFDPRMLLL